MDGFLLPYQSCKCPQGLYYKAFGTRNIRKNDRFRNKLAFAWTNALTYTNI